MVSADFVQTNGLAVWSLCARTYRWISSRRSFTLVKTPRWMHRRSRLENHDSTALSHEALVGVK